MSISDTLAFQAVAPPPTQKKNARWFGMRECIAMIIGALLYCGFSWFTSFAELGSGFGVELRPGVVIPIVFGFMYGPIVGFFVGAVGNTLGDLWLWDDIWWQWSVGNGIMGMIPGFYALYWRRYLTIKQQIIAYLVAAAGIAAGMGFASFSTIWLCQESRQLANCAVIPTTFDIAWDVFKPATRVNLINTAILLPVILFNIERLNLRSINWIESGLMRRLVIAIAVSAAMPIALLGFFLTQQFSGQGEEAENVMAKLIATIAVTMVFTIANASLVVQSITRSLLRLTTAAQLMEEGKLTRLQVRELQETEEEDEIGQLSRIFGKMAREVIQREEALRQQVAVLKIEVDAAKRAQEVQEITESDYFHSLQTRSKTLREQWKKRSEQGEDEDTGEGSPTEDVPQETAPGAADTSSSD